MSKEKLNFRGSLIAVGIGFWLTMAGGVSAGPAGDERIVGGDIADPADWPYAVAITDVSGDPFCAGTVISADSVLTAARCVVTPAGSSVDPDSFRLVTGRPDLSDEGAGQELEANAVRIHPKFVRKASHDLAVIRLSDPTTATPAVLPSGAEDEAATKVGGELRVAGWGSTRRNRGNPGSDILRAVSTFAAKNRKCESSFPRFPRFDAEEEICTQGERDGEHRTSSCYGDGGGPLVADTPNGARLVGAVSYGGYRCGVKHPTVYARVADNLGFITRKADLSREPERGSGSDGTRTRDLRRDRPAL